MPSRSLIAAVDLGSNSFRLEIGTLENGQFTRTEYLKETVRQGGGLDANRNLTPQAMQAGWDCLGRFGRRIAGYPAHGVRAVATQTLREAQNRDVFLERAQTLLGYPIEVISGHEEARLIYQGVAHMLDQPQEQRLVVDIGGRSTELIIGQGATAHGMESLPLGSISWSQRFFPQGQFSTDAFAQAEAAAQAALQPALTLCQTHPWHTSYGSAGTVLAIGDALVANGWPSGYVSQEGLDWLLAQLLSAGSTSQLRIAGMREDRKAIIGGGVSVIRALFKTLQIQRMEQATGGLRHGLICDLMRMA